jgi:hypothetical protein
MKKTLLVIFIHLLFRYGQAQVSAYHYVSFSDSGAVWLIEQDCTNFDSGSNPDLSWLQNKYSLRGSITDTTLSIGYAYKTLFLNQRAVTDYGLHYSDSSVAGYIREDTLAKKIYFRYSSTDTDKVLYDFSKSVGDSLDIHTPFSYFDYHIVAHAIIRRIDTVSYYGLWRKRFVFDCIDSTGQVVIDTSHTFAFTEGIGSEAGLMTPMEVNVVHPDACNVSLICFSYLDTTIYPVFGIGKCMITLSDGIHDPIGSHINLYPNPANNEFHLSCPDAGKYNSQINITDLLGQIIYSSPITDTETTHDISYLSSGLYTWRIISDNATIKTGKIIKQ